MKVSLTTRPVRVTSNSTVKFFVDKTVEVKNIKQITLELDQAGIKNPSKTSLDFFSSTKIDGVYCGLSNSRFYFEIDFDTAKPVKKYIYGKPITAKIIILLNSGEVIESILPDVIITK